MCFGVSLCSILYWEEKKKPCTQHQSRAHGCCSASSLHTSGAQPLQGHRAGDLINISELTVPSSFSHVRGIEVFIEHSAHTEGARRAGGSAGWVPVSPAHLLLFLIDKAIWAPSRTITRRTLAIMGAWEFPRSYCCGIENPEKFSCKFFSFLSQDCGLFFFFPLERIQGSFC